VSTLRGALHGLGGCFCSSASFRRNSEGMGVELIDFHSFKCHSLVPTLIARSPLKA
jgi:hypothetical protein